MEQKIFKFTDLELNDRGEFQGYASVYGIQDLVGDVVDRGAFSRTLQHKGGKVPFLSDHDPTKRTGVVYLEDTDVGLKVRGILNLATDYGKRVYEEMKFYLAHTLPTGLSIGYDTVKEQWEGAARHLKEIKLYEVSHVTFPALPDAHVTGIKETKPPIRGWDETTNSYRYRVRPPDDFVDGTLRTVDITDGVKAVMGRLEADGPMTPQSVIFSKEEFDSLDNAKAWLDEHEEMIKEGGKMKENDKETKKEEQKDEEAPEEKAGRVLSKGNMKLVKNAVEALQALLSAAESDSETSEDKQEEPADDAKDTEDDSLQVELKKLREDMKRFRTKERGENDGS